jgi:hypothetical protein
VSLFQGGYLKAAAVLTRCENELIKHTVQAVKDAVLTEQIQIEIESLGIKEAA